MTTVPKVGDGPPPDNAKTTLVSDAMSGNYGRPASGGAPQAGRPEGTPGPQAPPGVIPPNPIVGGVSMYPPAGGLNSDYNNPSYGQANAGSAPTAGGTQAGPNMGHGATIVVPSSGDRPSGGKESAESGTVGSSGNQGNAPPAA